MAVVIDRYTARIAIHVLDDAGYNLTAVKIQAALDASYAEETEHD